MGLGKDFFKQAYAEQDAPVEQAEGTPDKVADEVIVGKEAEVKVPEAVTEEPIVAPKFNIDGVDYTLEEVRGWKQDGLRQSDYTKKTQELASARKAFEDLGNVIPEADESNSDTNRIARLEADLATKDLDNTITSLKAKYNDFDEVAVLTEAQNRKMFDNKDLEFIYKAIRADVSNTPIDMEAFKAQSIAEYKAQIATEKQKNKEATSGSIIASTPGTLPIEYEDKLDNAEKEYCRKRGYTYKEYVEMKSSNY